MEIVGVGINLSLLLMVFGIALTAGIGGVKLIRRDPVLLLRALVAMYVVMPLVAVAIAFWFELSRLLLIVSTVGSIATLPYLKWRQRLSRGARP